MRFPRGGLSQATGRVYTDRDGFRKRRERSPKRHAVSSAQPREDKRPCQEDEGFRAHVKGGCPIPEATREIAVQFEGGAVGRTLLITDEPKRRGRLTAKHSL
jgi:hypothetical protein